MGFVKTIKYVIEAFGLARIFSYGITVTHQRNQFVKGFNAYS